MSSCWGSLSLLLVLGVVLASGRPCQFIGEKLKQSHDSIADVLKLKEPEVGLDPLFSSVIRSNSSLQVKVNLMNATLDVYRQILSSILQHQDRPGSPALLNQLSDSDRIHVKSEVKDFQHKIENLTRNLGRVNHNREDVLSKLHRIQVDDPLVQKKALAQFKEVYQAAHVLISPEC